MGHDNFQYLESKPQQLLQLSVQQILEQQDSSQWIELAIG